MKVKELIKKLQELEPEKDIIFSTDEEGNDMYEDVYVEEFEMYKYSCYRLYVIKGTEIDIYRR